jgi:hypothetical protein
VRPDWIGDLPIPEPPEPPEPDAALRATDAREDDSTDLDQITNHPFEASVWPDTCGYEVDGWPCGYSRAEHATA